MRYVALLVLFSFAPFIVSECPAQTKPEYSDTPTKKVEEFQSPFRYVIIAGVSRLQMQTYDPDHQIVDVLMERRAFNERNLKALFTLISKRYSKSRWLMVNVYTSLESIKTPEEYDVSILIGPHNNFSKHGHAAFVRRDGCDEEFTYSIPGRVINKTVWLDSCKPK